VEGTQLPSTNPTAEEKEILREFLAESTENLAVLESEMLQLEREPDNAQLIGSIFRAIHTLKGSCGFLGFGRLQTIAPSHRTYSERTSRREDAS
jgi:chemotaxis protein histidine kinase CheA